MGVGSGSCAMPRYFFDIFNGGGPVPDEEGVELPDLAAARAAAIVGIRSMLCEEVEQGRIDLDGRIEIYNCGRERLAAVPFGEAVEVRMPT